MFNTYAMDSEHCPECDALELMYIINCSAVHCQDCGKWFELDKTLIEE